MVCLSKEDYDPTVTHTPVHVLIVEDETIIATALAVRLKGLGYHVLAATSSAADALRSVQQNPPDVVLMDIRLSGETSGIEAAQHIQETFDVPVVFTTAYADPDTVMRVKKVEPYGYLLKPYDDSSLQVAIELAVYRHRAERERRRLEHQLLQSQKMDVIGHLAGGIAHDFNNLLAIIMGTAEMMKRRPDLQPQLIPDLFQTVGRGSALIRRLMLFSRPDSVQPRDVNVSAALTSLRTLLQRLVGPLFPLTMSCPSELFVFLDPLHFDQLVMNLVINARDAMPEGGEIVVEVSAHEGQWITLSVEDTGEGISPENLEQIFEPFFSTKDASDGTGLGLAVVRRIVQRCGGSVSVDSTVTVGTTFTVTLPQVLSPQISDQILPTASSSQSVKRRILVVDDEPMVRELVTLQLQSDGHEVVGAEGPGQAIAIMQEHDAFDLLLTDVRMPYMNGPELARILRRTHPSIKVGFFSGYAGKEEVSPLIFKPFTRHALLQFVDDLFDDAVRIEDSSSRTDGSDSPSNG